MAKSYFRTSRAPVITFDLLKIHAGVTHGFYVGMPKFSHHASFHNLLSYSEFKTGLIDKCLT